MSPPPPASHTRSDSGAGRKKRPRPLPHVNARNLAIEKKRREQMNGNFLDLAHLVPSLANTQRLTKVHIVSQTIEHLRAQRDLCAAAARDMQALLADNERLAAQLRLLQQRPSVAVVPGTMARLLAASQLGTGTATLRDAHEGPEPKSRAAAAVVPVGVETESEQHQHQQPQEDVAAGLALTDQGHDTMAQFYQGVWTTGYELVGMPETQQQQQKQFLWSCSIPETVPDSSALLAPTGVSAPPPPRDALEHDVIAASLAYPSALLPDDTLYTNVGLHETNVGDVWPGLGLCSIPF